MLPNLTDSKVYRIQLGGTQKGFFKQDAVSG